MFISALSITTDSTPLATPLPAFGAAQRLQDPSFSAQSLPVLSTMQQMQTLLGEMYLMLKTLMGGNPPEAAQSGTSVDKSSAPTTDLKDVQGSDFGKKLATQAEKTANQINTPGLCLKGVNDAMQAMGLPVHREAAAWMAVDDFQKNPRFREVKVSKSQLKSLPAGAVVIWDKGSGLPYGHISVALGDGREASSKVRNQLLLNTNFHVFLPK
ncbi:MAG: CHAP domain-containing protein [Candidatus Eremiobacteraeota bacterium]|nr:CHAP domain-containing protein [Candidatus Eremiobacteraeota bacterium]